MPIDDNLLFICTLVGVVAWMCKTWAMEDDYEGF